MLLPTRKPTVVPSKKPTNVPTTKPSGIPSFDPTFAPSTPTITPTVEPTFESVVPSLMPSESPTYSVLPTMIPSTVSPSFDPSYEPTVTPTFSPTIVTAVAMWKAENDANDVFNVNNGVFGGSNPSPALYTTGYDSLGQAFQFDGTNYITVPAADSIDIGASPLGLSVALWMKATTTGPLVEWGDSSINVAVGNMAVGFHIWLDTLDRILVNVRIDGSGSYSNNVHCYTLPLGANYFLNIWRHFVFTYDVVSGDGNYYIDGQFQGNFQNYCSNFGPNIRIPTQKSFNQLNIGHRMPVGGLGEAFFTGALDDISLWQRPLTFSEIQDLYKEYYITAIPTFTPTITPTTYMPSQYPTGLYQYVNLVGSVHFDPVYTGLCTNIAIQIQFMVSRTIRYHDVIRLATPGLTSGPCTTANNGQHISIIALFNSTEFIATYVEGNYTNSFRDSYIEFSINLLKGLKVDTPYSIRIDRSNGLKRSCSANYTKWEVHTGRCNRMLHCKHYQSFGTLPVTSPFNPIYLTNDASKCFAYNSSLSITPSNARLIHQLQFNFLFAFPLQPGSLLIINLPGFTNRQKYTNISQYDTINYNLDLGANYIDLLGKTTNLTNGPNWKTGVYWASGFDWEGYWYEDPQGSNNHFKNSKLIFKPIPNIPAGYTMDKYSTVSQFWLSINQYPSALSSQYGRIANYSGFTYEIIPPSYTSGYYYMNKTAFTMSNQIG